MCTGKIGVLCVCNEAQSLPCPSVRKSVLPVLSKRICFSSESIIIIEDRMEKFVSLRESCMKFFETFINTVHLVQQISY